MQGATLDASDFRPAFDLTDSASSEPCEMQGGTLDASDFRPVFELTDSASSEPSEMQGGTLEATEPTDTDSFASESGETYEPTECKSEEKVLECKLRRTRSSINLREEPSPDETCKGEPVVFGGWTEPPEKKRRVLTTVDTFETPGKSDLRGRPARQVREWVRLSSTCSDVRQNWGV